jgi:glycosyltransferase involved in cell wall biosynthesis
VETVTAAVLEADALEIFDRRHCDLSKRREKHKAGTFDLANAYWAIIHLSRMLNGLVRFRPDVVYMPVTGSWSGFLRDAALALMARISGAKVVGHVHGGWFNRILALEGIRGRIARFGIERFNMLLVLGQSWRKIVEDYGYTGEIHVVPSMFRADLRRAASDFHRNYDKPTTTGLFVGHVGRGKGIIDLLEAIALLRLSGKEIPFSIVGPPQFSGDWEEVTRKRSELGLEELVELNGPLQGDALFEKFRCADFFVLPSHFEGLPVVIFEAGLFGLPVIATPVGAIPELLTHQKNGLLVSPGDVHGLAQAISTLADSSTLRMEIGRTLKDSMDRYDPDVICKEIAELIARTANSIRV